MILQQDLQKLYVKIISLVNNDEATRTDKYDFYEWERVETTTSMECGSTDYLI